MSEPRAYAWVIPRRLAVAERPGRGGRSHRRALRRSETRWWRQHGVDAIVSGMRSRHALAAYEEEGFRVRWHPLPDVEAACAELPLLVRSVRELLDTGGGAVLVHVDRPGEWLAAVDGALRLGLGLAGDGEEALRQVVADGLPVGSLTTSILGAVAPAVA